MPASASKHKVPKKFQQFLAHYRLCCFPLQSGKNWYTRFFKGSIYSLTAIAPGRKKLSHTHWHWLEFIPLCPISMFGINHVFLFLLTKKKYQCGTLPIPMYECSFLSSPNEPKINAGGKQETLTTCTGLTFKKEFFHRSGIYYSKIGRRRTRCRRTSSMTWQEPSSLT